MNNMDGNLIAARVYLAWRALEVAESSLPTRAKVYGEVALMLAGRGDLADNLAMVAKELREAAIPHTEVADLLDAVIGNAPVAKAEPVPAVTQLPRVDLTQPAKGGAYLVELPPCAPPAVDALYRWQVKPGESWQTDANKQVIRAYGPMPKPVTP